MLWIPLALAVIASPDAPALSPVKARTAARPHARLPFIEDDYPRALAEARRLNRPLFVEAWAPW
jgi:hypothetical protein